jgi:hypothetical protein
MLLDEIGVIIGRSVKKEWRKFGITMAIIFSIIAIVFHIKEHEAVLYIVFIASFFLISALLVPFLLKPIYLSWMMFATLLGFVTSRIILGILFSLVFTPVGLFWRIIGKDMLNEKINRDSTSYWIKKEEIPFDKENVERQY